MKKCSRCKNLLPRSEFYGDARSTDGLVSDCKECRRVQARARYGTDEYRRYIRELRRNQRSDPTFQAQDREALRAWRKQNPERYRAQYEARNARARGTRKKRIRTPELRAKHLAEQNRRRARMLDGVSPGVSPEQWGQILELHGHRCVYCGVGGKLTREHSVPISRGGIDSPENVVPACMACNVRKKNRLPEEYREYLRRVEAA